MSEITPKGTTAVDVAAGLCLGTLTGFLVGLTTASVTTTVLASVLAIATAFIGLAGDAKFLDGLVNHARVASFAGAMACALLAGIWMRTHQTLSPSVEDLFIQLKAAEFTEAEAKDVVRFVKFGLVPTGATVAVGDQAAIVTRGGGTLFNDAPSWCDDFRRRQSQPVDDQLAWLQGQEYTRDIALRMKNLPAERRAEVAGQALFYLCGLNE